MKFIFAYISIFLFAADFYAQRQIRVGLFQDLLPESFVVHCIAGEYIISADGNERKMKPGDLFYLTLSDESILLTDGDLNYGFYRKIYFQNISRQGVFRIRPVHPAAQSRNYEGDLEIFMNHETLYAINVVDFERYIAGVTETEGGPSAPVEFYKAQAVLCRTYAIRNFNSHQAEGFNLCDHTHCQAYKGRCEQNPKILESVLSTHNLVLTGRYLGLINAVYHSNSGGETQRASDIWTNDLEYLQAILDPFSKDQPNYRWEKSIPLELWKNYLVSNGFSSVHKAGSSELMINQQHRRRYFILEKDTLRIERVRNDFNLRSGLFDMELKGDSIIFRGRGYGHGVGMSQEGAMEMARQGFSFSDILRFYFHQVQIRDIVNIPDEQLPVEFREVR